EWGNPWRILFLDKERSAPFPVALQYRVDAWSGRSKPIFRLPVPKIHLIYSPRVEDVSDIKLIRTDTTIDLSQKAEQREPTTALRRARRSVPRRAQPWWSGAEEGGKRGTCSMCICVYVCVCMCVCVCA